MRSPRRGLRQEELLGHVRVAARRHDGQVEVQPLRGVQAGQVITRNNALGAARRHDGVICAIMRELFLEWFRVIKMSVINKLSAIWFLISLLCFNHSQLVGVSTHLVFLIVPFCLLQKKSVL